MKISSAKWLATPAVAAALTVAMMASAPAHSDGHEGTPFAVRDNVMHLIGSHMKHLGDIAKGEAEMDASTLTHAQSLQVLSATVPYLFPEGSMHAMSRAKPEIWSDWEGFVEVADAFAAATPGVVAAVESGDAEQIGPALQAVGRTCGACHDDYRGPKVE